MKAEIQHYKRRRFKVDKSMLRALGRIERALFFFIFAFFFSRAKEAVLLFTSLQVASGFRVNDAKEAVLKSNQYFNFFPLCENNRKTVSNVFGISKYYLLMSP